MNKHTEERVRLSWVLYEMETYVKWLEVFEEFIRVSELGWEFVQ